MTAAPHEGPHSLRTTARLLSHCALARDREERPSARARLERELGLELAQLLIGALACGPRRALV